MSHYIERNCPIYGMFMMDVDGSADCDECPDWKERKEFATANAVRIYMDGDKWCAVKGDFENLQESPAGFGYSPEGALNALIAERKR